MATLPTSLPAGHVVKADEIQAILDMFLLEAHNEDTSTSGSTTSATFTQTLTGASVLGVGFVVPPSGVVRVDWSVVQVNSTTQFTLTSFELRTGSQTVGSGSVAQAATDNNASQQIGTSATRVGSYAIVPGLTPYANANVQLMYRIQTATTTTGTFTRRQVSVRPWGAS